MAAQVVNVGQPMQCEILIAHNFVNTQSFRVFGLGF